MTDWRNKLKVTLTIYPLYATPFKMHIILSAQCMIVTREAKLILRGTFKILIIQSRAYQVWKDILKASQYVKYEMQFQEWLPLR